MTSNAVERRPGTGALLIAFALVYLCWGTTYLALKKAVREEGLPPLLFGGVRVCIAGWIILALQACRRQALGVPWSDMLPVAMGAIFFFIGGNGLINLAGQTLDSGVCAVLAATTPLWIGLFELLWPTTERLSRLGWLGLLVGSAGVLVLSLPELRKINQSALDAGYLFVLGSACSWALGSLIVRRHSITCSHWTTAAYQMILGGGGLALIGLAVGETGRMPDHITTRAMIAFVWLLIVGSLIGFTAYNWLLGHVSATQAGTYAYVNPAIAVVVGVIDGEEATAWLIGGIIVILAGVALVRAGQVYKNDKKPSNFPNRPQAELCGKEARS